MSTTTPLNFGAIVTNLKSHYHVWLIPTVLVTAAATVYAVMRPDIWRASQAILVRDEAGGNIDRAGRFASVDAMKTAQETILEITRNQAVLAKALETVGPPADRISEAPWPSQNDVENLQDAISVSAPKGAEFGRTEVIYLSVKSNDRKRAIALTVAVGDQLEARLLKLRDSKAQSIVGELQRGVELARADLDKSTVELQAMESQVGSDLGELRMLNELGSGDSNLRTGMNQIKNELRQAQTQHETSEQLLKLLLAAQDAPAELVATPSRLLESQPALRRLKDGLVDAQLRTAQLLGKMNPDHPEVQSAMAAEEEVRQHLHRELDVAVRGLTAELKVSAKLAQSLEGQLADVTARLDRLAQMRAGYGNLVAESRQRSETLQAAEKALADARASETAARSSSLLTRLDQPVTGASPLGPSRSMIVLAGFFGGLATGFGCVLLTAPLNNLQFRGRRFSDVLRGRRATDFSAAAARSTDRAGATPRRRSVDEVARGRRANDFASRRKPLETVPADCVVPGRRAGDGQDLLVVLRIPEHV